MNETFLKLTSLLGHSWQAGREEDSTPGRQQDQAKQSLKEMFDEEHAKSWEHSSSFPSFSLDHAKQLKIEGSQTKEEVQIQASALLAQPIHVDVSGGCKEPESIPNVMMENVYSSFDKLVDARILAYSKILGNHWLTLAESHWKGSVGDDLCSGAQVIEYKLKTLLEIGTNIYADSAASTFTIDGDHQIEERDGWTEITYPISMKVEINDLRLPCSESHNIKVSFEAPGTIQGEFDNILCSGFWHAPVGKLRSDYVAWSRGIIVRVIEAFQSSDLNNNYATTPLAHTIFLIFRTFLKAFSSLRIRSRGYKQYVSTSTATRCS
jgi:hypothetical protein